MKKIFLFCAAVLVALAANATVVNIDNSSEGNFRRALRDSQAGDTIIMADGTYDEQQGVSVKHPLTVLPADGARPVVPLPSYIQIYSSIEFKGIKFDGQNTGEHCFYIYPDTVRYLKLEDCEICNYPKYAVTGSQTAHVNECKINNCYFHNNGRAAVYFPTSTTADQHVCNHVSVTNSTIANLTALNTFAIEVNNYNGSDEWKFDKNVRLDVDHVTFYNCVVGSYGPIRAYYSHNVHITNCIFAEATATSTNATYCYGADSEINHCLSFNIGGHHSGPTIDATTNLSADPQFVDAANGNYMLAEGSPAIGAASDGSNLGDPHWNARKLYLKPGVWDVTDKNEKYGVWCFGIGSHSAQWSGFMTAVDGEDGVYTATIPAGFKKINFARLDGDAAATAPDWANKWNQTNDLVILDKKDLFSIEGWGDPDSYGSWSRLYPILTNGYYLIGKFSGVDAWNVEDLTAAKLFTKNEAASGEEYALTFTLAEGDGIKVAKVENDEIKARYIEGTGNEYVVDAANAGEKTIYFRPNKDGGSGWSLLEGFILIAEKTTGINNVEAAEKAVKMIENGQLVIIKNGVKYNVVGSQIK